MAIIYTYPTKATPVDDDLILISDSADSNKTKQITVASIKGQTAGVTSIIAGTNVTISSTGAGGTGDVTINSSGGSATSPDSPVNSVQFNEAGAFGGSNNFKYTDSNRTLTIGEQDVNSGIINIAGGSTGGAGQLQLGDDGTSGNYITLKAATDIPDPYSIVLPGTDPTGGNKILESDTNGNLSWINTPTGSSLPIEEEGSQITAAAAKINFTGTGATASASGNDVTVNIPAMSIENNGSALISGITTLDFSTNLTPTSAGPGTNKVTITASSTTSKLGFTPLSIYEATGSFQSQQGEEGSAFSIIRQSVCETDCTIDKVDFFRLAGTDRVTIAVYTGTIASGAGNLVLSGGQSIGTANQINTITFNTPYTFSAGDDIVILVSLQYATGNYAEVLGAINLHSNASLGRRNATYYSTPPSDFSTILENFSLFDAVPAAALHFYDE